jgi:spermidine synthase
MKRSGETPAPRLRRTAVVRTEYQNFEIWKSALATEFRVAGAVHAFHHQHRFLTGLVWDMLTASALLGKRDEPRSLLMLGLAGGTTLRILRHLLPSCRFTAIDIDGEIISLARRHMALDDTGAEVIIGDAYEWLQKNHRTFDVVIDDIYLAGRTDVFRPQAMDRRLLESLRRCVAPGGVLAVNLDTALVEGFTPVALQGRVSAIASLSKGLQSFSAAAASGLMHGIALLTGVPGSGYWPVQVSMGLALILVVLLLRGPLLALEARAASAGA